MSMLPLRERKKQETRDRLAKAALDLAITRGVAGVRVEDIASAANVSPRTFNNYFPSKEAAILGSASDRAQRIGETLADSPADIRVEDAAREAVLSAFPDIPDKAWLSQLMLVRDDPDLLAEQRRGDARMEALLASAVAQREGVDPTLDIYPRLFAATLVAAIHAAIQHWLATDGKGDFRATLEDALQRLSVGQRKKMGPRQNG